MRLVMSTICNYGACTITSRNFTEGEKLLNANYVLKCGRIEEERNDVYRILGYCKQFSAPNSEPHEIKGDIELNGSIASFTCSCKAGLSGKCKHVLAVLLFLNRNDINEIEVLSCTDVKCAWKKLGIKKPEPGKAIPISESKCYEKSYRSIDTYTLSDAQREKLEKKISNYNACKSSLSKHM